MNLNYKNINILFTNGTLKFLIKKQFYFLHNKNTHTFVKDL